MLGAVIQFIVSSGKEEVMPGKAAKVRLSEKQLEIRCESIQIQLRRSIEAHDLGSELNLHTGT